MSERALSLTSGEAVACAAGASTSEHLQPWLQIETYPEDDRVLVVVSGDLDIDTEQMLQSALRDALVGSVSGVDLDLGGVEFCDCSGLNVLLRMRRRALADAKSLGIRTAGASVERLLDLTHTRPLFAWTNEDAQYEDADQDLRIELLQLRQAMQTRPVIDLARGVLMATFALSAEAAWKVLVTVSQRTNTKLRHVAQNLVNSVNGDPLPEPQQQQFAAAVADHSTSPAPLSGVQG
ncbi:ANTAR domain-containing protein [Streptomyces sp. NBC_00996]|uniref:ANTAR domain-containing protein n=1 Tax=Streptomyces sp. NBC_00996 TaxID=2903710 RepID=UPI00386BA9BD|nr:ANTAR domain-containing protein [Streptomyces sp. NBC_00996]